MNYKTKDYVFIGVIGAIYTVLYFGISMAMFFTGLGVWGHVLSPGIFGLIGGIIVVFLVTKVPKKWILTVFTIVTLIVMSLFGGGYLPWIITSLAGALVGDLVASRAKYKNKISLAISYGLIQVGSCLGAIVPAVFFAESYIEDYVKRGQSVETMKEFVRLGTGTNALVVIGLVFLMAMIGVFLGTLILKKHLKD